MTTNLNTRGKKRKAEKQIIKGLSTSFGPLGYDVIKETNRDYMHTVLLIIVKMFVSRCFDTAYRHSPYYCGDKLSFRDSRRANIKPPNHVSDSLPVSEVKTFCILAVYKSGTGTRGRGHRDA